MYEYVPTRNTMPGSAPAQGQQPSSRFGCLTRVLIVIFFIYLMKACGVF